MSEHSLMARPRKIEDDRIIETAQRLFLQRGLAVTTAEIAEQVGISEGTIFRRFATKRALFVAAMGLEGQQGWAAGLQARVGKGDVRQNLRALARQVMAYFMEVQPRLMLLWTSRNIDPREMKILHGPNSSPRRNHAALARYLEQEMSLGRIRTCDADTVAGIFLGSLWKHVIFELMGVELHAPVTRAAFARRLVETLWGGLDPQRGGAP